MPTRYLFLAVCATLILSSQVITAAIPDSSGVFYGCYAKSGSLRLVDPPATQCKAGEVAVSWNIAGQPGPPGTGRNLVLKDSANVVIGIMPYPFDPSNMVVRDEGGIPVAIPDVNPVTSSIKGYDASTSYFETADCSGTRYVDMFNGRLFIDQALGNPISYRTAGIPAEHSILSFHDGTQCTSAAFLRTVRPAVPYSIPTFAPPFHLEWQ